MFTRALATGNKAALRLIPDLTTIQTSKRHYFTYLVIRCMTFFSFTKEKPKSDSAKGVRKETRRLSTFSWFIAVDVGT